MLHFNYYIDHIKCEFFKSIPIYHIYLSYYIYISTNRYIREAYS